jgi:hypothetical protein
MRDEITTIRPALQVRDISFGNYFGPGNSHPPKPQIFSLPVVFFWPFSISSVEARTFADSELYTPGPLSRESSRLGLEPTEIAESEVSRHSSLEGDMP